MTIYDGFGILRDETTHHPLSPDMNALYTVYKVIYYDYAWLSLNSYTIIVKILSKTYPLNPVSFISVIALFRFFGRGEGVCTQAISVKV